MAVTAGVDEVGRGALFGPVVAAAVIVQADKEAWLWEQGVSDSKLLTPRKREKLVPIIQSVALDVQVAWVSVARIDRINILQASLQAMAKAIGCLHPCPDQCFVDGNQLIPGLSIAQKTVVKGDRHVVAIAAASIIAKVWRDALIVRLSRRYPGYDLASNKGYGSPKHLASLRTLGPTRYHRRSFKSCQQLPLVLD